MAIPVFVLAGQSNARRISSEVRDSLAAKYGSDGFVLVEKFVAGAPLTREAPNKDDWASPEELSAQLISDLRDAIAENPNTYSGGMIWVQGEADTWETANPGLYRSRLISLVDRVSREVSSETGSAASTFANMALVISELSDQAPAAPDRPNWSLIVEAQQITARASETVVSVDPDGLAESDGFTQDTMFDDNLHYSSGFSRALSDGLVETLGALSETMAGTNSQALGDYLRVFGTKSDDSISGTWASEAIRGRGGDDTLHGGGGNDNLRSGNGNDKLIGGSGNDQIKALQGADLLAGGAGRDFLYGGRGNDTLRGGFGDDAVWGESGSDNLSGQKGDDLLLGGDGNDRLWGGDGNDTLFGERGRDFIGGGAGDDILTGGRIGQDGDGQRDVFIFRSSNLGSGGFDRVTDFERNFDQIDLRSFGFDDFFEDVLSRASGTANDTKIEFGQGDVLYIENLPISELDSSLVIL